ncbi:GEVED domain-containing protein [Hymenobacter terrenus]|uniref:GEVED domain-containing protein n=1 Tax=Hymenobacter terrenus TaxID=1629124 RepID=UPI000A98A4C6|nr:GEVED domain-containing protein [Hymenobacter terrenus]
MTPRLHSRFRVTPAVAAVLLMVGLSPAAFGQTCPIAATCTPGRATSPQAGSFNMGIFNVTVGNNLINKTSVGQADGYQDYGCTTNATLAVGQSYPISVRTGLNAPENVRVWIDYNNDGAFTGTNELVFSSNNSIQHNGTLTPPATATLSTNLRMRVAADYALGIIPTACSTPQYSQTEDYSVRLIANVNPPVAAFTTNGTITCSGCVQFTDASQNLPTAWLWNFGDGTTSTQQNPNHCYTTAGTYTVTLRATNAAGTSAPANASVTYNSVVPLAASCTPQTLNFFANYGITRFRLGSIDNTSANGSASYQDFTCPQRTDLTVGSAYPMIITTGGVNAHDIRVYLDKDNNGTLTAAEQLYQSLNTATPGATTTLTIPATGVVLNQPLRLRVVADAVSSTTAGPCTNPASGQAEDYTVILWPVTTPPTVNFSSSYVPGTCSNPIQFTDLSTNAPTSWLWNFGDGTTSTQQNPSHQYTTTGTYTVSLSATNIIGTATATQPNAVTVQVPCLTYCASNGTGGGGAGGPLPSPFYISAVAVPNAQPAFSNSTGVATGGYANYTAQPISIANQVNLTVLSNLNTTHRTTVWVDWNTNGQFEAAELVATGITTGVMFTSNFLVPSAASGRSFRMRINVAINTSTAFPCATNILNAEVEDYLLQVRPLASRDALALPALSLYPNPTLDGRLHLRLPDANAAGLYATEVQNLLGATILRTALRLGPAADAELDLSSLPAGVYVLRLRDARGQTALRRVVRE